jgi:transglutaminase-like putative cysteine protease
MLARQLLLSSLHSWTTVGFENHTMRSPTSLLPGRTAAVAALCKLLMGLSLFLLLAVSVAQASTFQLVSADELKMTSEPMAPGAPAILLFHQVDRDDNGRTSHEDNYFRVKILTEEGRKYADVEIPFSKQGGGITGIRARTIKPDGTIVNFDGKVFEKTIVKAKGVRYLAKTFTLPDIQVGGIIEYYYTEDLREYSLFESHWILSEDLFTKRAQFSLKPYKSSFQNNFMLRWSWQRLPPGSEPKQGPDGIVRMEATNIPAFQTEDFMPPANELKSRVDFVYEDDLTDRDPEKYWKHIGKKSNDYLESFLGKRKAMDAAVAEIVSSGDAPEVKLRKIYDRVQSIRNTSYEVQKTMQEEKRAKEKPVENVEELWKRGYGNGTQLTWLFLALARSAGFEAYGCWVSDRREYFFVPQTMESRKLNSNVVVVKLNGKDVYFDPGAAFTPFGMLTWSETGTQGLRLDKDGGSWIRTTLPQSSESKIVRNARLKLNGDTGDLEGKLTITYAGLEGMYPRLENRNADEVERKKFLEQELKEQIPAAAEVELTNKPDWANSEAPLVAEFDVKIPGWASSAGKRAVVPVGIFTAAEKRIFEHANRVHPIYFRYPFEKADDITIELPSGWQTSSMPKPQAQDGHVIVYNLKVEDNKGSLHLTRKLSVDVLILEEKYYAALRNFFQIVRSGDEEQIVLQPGTATSSN